MINLSLVELKVSIEEMSRVLVDFARIDIVVEIQGVIIEVLETKIGSNPARSDLDAWINSYKIPVTSMKDPDNAPNATFNALGIRETVFIVDLSTMKILTVINGSVSGVPPSSTCRSATRGMRKP